MCFRGSQKRGCTGAWPAATLAPDVSQLLPSPTLCETESGSVIRSVDKNLQEVSRSFLAKRERETGDPTGWGLGGGFHTCRDKCGSEVPTAQPPWKPGMRLALPTRTERRERVRCTFCAPAASPWPKNTDSGPAPAATAQGRTIQTLGRHPDKVTTPSCF